MTQWISIAAVVGVGARHLVERFRRWNGARVLDPEDPLIFEPCQWPIESRREMAAYSRAIRENAASPPMAFYREYVDPWSGGNIFQLANCGNGMPLIEVGFESSEMVCLPLIDASAAAGEFKAARRQFLRRAGAGDSERRWFVDSLSDACEACSWLKDDATIVITRTVVEGTVLDEEMQAAASCLPGCLSCLSQ